MKNLFDHVKIRSLEFRNRIGVSPMCQYSAIDGVPTDWHLVHLGARATGGAGMVIAEATAVTPEGRISPGCTGIYNDEQVSAWKRITKYIRSQGAVPALQLAHAGRKASTQVPQKGGGPLAINDGGWQVVAPSALPFDQNSPTPHPLTTNEILEIQNAFVLAAKRALDAGFEVIEIHAAHGYLLHEFLSPYSNHRTDEYGGSFANRTRFLLEVVRKVRMNWPEGLPLMVRLSATDWLEQTDEPSWTLEQSVELCQLLKAEGVDIADVSTGGNVPFAKIPAGPGYQVLFAKEIHDKAGILTAAVGLITDSHQANEIIEKNHADFILIGREFLRDPFWVRKAAKELEFKIDPPSQYLRGW